MTLDEFSFEVDTWETLLDFCQEHGCDICEDIIQNDDLKEIIEQELKSCIEYTDWTVIRDALYHIDEYAAFYIHHDGLDFDEADHFLLSGRIQATQDWAEQNDIFDESDPEDSTFPSLFDDDDDDDDDDDFTMFAISSLL